MNEQFAKEVSQQCRWNWTVVYNLLCQLVIHGWTEAPWAAVPVAATWWHWAPTGMGQLLQRKKEKKKNKPHIVMEWIDLMVLLIAHETHPVCVPLMPFVRCLVFKGGRMSVKWPDWIRSALRSLINTFSSAAAAAAVDRGENKDLKNMHLGTFFNFLFFGLCWFKSKSQPDMVKKKKKGPSTAASTHFHF